MTEITGGVLVGRVRTREKKRGTHVHTLEILAPKLNNYAFMVCLVDHGVELYPLTMELPAEGKVYPCPDEETYVTKLGALLRSERTQSAIAGMLAQSKVQK